MSWVENGPAIDFAGVALNYTLVDLTRVTEIVSDRIAELILTDFGATDLIMFADQLERRQIPPDAEVV